VGQAEILWWRPDGPTTLSPGADVRLALGLRIEVLIRLYRGLQLVVGAAGLGWVRNLRLTAQDGQQEVVLLAPDPVSVQARVGLAYEF
jgi:hypothetical protein